MTDEKQELSIPEPDSRDTAHDVAKAALSFIPGAPELFEYFVVPPLEKRRREWEADVTKILLQLVEERTISLDKLRSEEHFTTVILQATRVAIGTHQEAKRRALRNAVINTALGINIREDLQLLFIRYLDELVPSHVVVLQFFVAHEKELANAESYEVLYAAYQQENAGLTRDEFKMLCGDLINRGLIRISQYVDDFEDIYHEEVIITKSADDSVPKLKVTDIGRKLLLYITHDV